MSVPSTHATDTVGSWSALDTSRLQQRRRQASRRQECEMNSEAPPRLTNRPLLALIGFICPQKLSISLERLDIELAPLKHLAYGGLAA